MPKKQKFISRSSKFNLNKLGKKYKNFGLLGTPHTPPTKNKKFMRVWPTTCQHKSPKMRPHALQLLYTCSPERVGLAPLLGSFWLASYVADRLGSNSSSLRGRAESTNWTGSIWLDSGSPIEAGPVRIELVQSILSFSASSTNLVRSILFQTRAWTNSVHGYLVHSGRTGLWSNRVQMQF